MALNDSSMHVVAAIGACVLSAALAIPTVWWTRAASTNDDDSADDSKHLVIRASLAMLKSSKKKQPQKKFQQAVKEAKPQGVSHDENKVAPKQCCTSQADCNAAKLALGTSCADGQECKNNMCVRPKRDKRPTSPDGPVTIPDRTAGLDDPVGDPTPNTEGSFDGSKHGLAKVNSGDPWFARLSNDFFSFLEFPKLEAASAAEPCVQITADGKIADTEFRSNKRSDNEGLNAEITKALKKLKDKRNRQPEPVPTHLLRDVTTQWTCFPVDNQTRQQD
jgi:hypothetical protein